MEPFAAVLTGDLIGSTEADAARVERSMTGLAEAAALIGNATRSDTRFTRYRGDGWQLYLHEPKDFLWAAVCLNAVLKADPESLPTRIAIGLGAVDNLGESGLAAASGTAFIESGRALDKMAASGQTMALAGDGVDAIQRSLLAFIADRISSWSREQAEVVKFKLMYGDPPQQDIAHELKITRQAVGSRLQAAGYTLIVNACRAYHDVDFSTHASR